MSASAIQIISLSVSNIFHAESAFGSVTRLSQTRLNIFFELGKKHIFTNFSRHSGIAAISKNGVYYENSKSGNRSGARRAT